MKRYKLPFILHEPGAETEDKFMAEIPALPGCRAWGDTVAQTLENLQSVAATFIESHADMGDDLPLEVEAASVDIAKNFVLNEVLIAV